MLERLQLLEDKYEELNQKMVDPDVLGNPAELNKLAKAQSDLEDVVVAFRQYKKVLSELEDSKAMLQEKLDPEMDEMVKMEIKELAEQKESLEEKEGCVVLSLEAYAGEDKITEFGGGKVTISVPFEVPQGKSGSDFYVAYVADDGTITEMPTTYKDGVLTFQTTHFSSYVVLDSSSETDDTNTSTGDNTPILLLVSMLVISAASLAVLIPKKKNFA